jgi:capsular exopolysaccharide synthesis family protein
VVLDDPQSLAAEAYRVLRVHYAMSGAKPRSVLITSADVGAGKSTVTANLGILLAQVDRSVLLVDADLRRPVLHTLLRVPGSPGLTSYLSHQATLEAVVTRTPVPKLALMPSGPIPPNPSDLLSSRRMRDLLRTLAEQYDVVLVDSPPVLAASDATTLAPIVDGVLLVVGSGVPEMSLRRAKEQLKAVHGRILGAVVNQRHERDLRRPERDGLTRVPRAATVRLGGVGRAAAAAGAEVAEASVRRARHVGRRALDGVTGVPRAAMARLGGAGRAVAALGVGAAEASLRPVRSVGHHALAGLSRIPRAAIRVGDAGRDTATAWASRLRAAGQAVTALSVRVGETSQRQLGHAGRRALSGWAGVSRRWASGVSGGARATAALATRVGEMSQRQLRHAGQGALSQLSRVPRAAVRLGVAGRALAALGVGVVEASQRQLRHTGHRALSGLSGVSRGWASRLSGGAHAMAAWGSRAGEASQRQLGHAAHRALSGLSGVSRAAIRAGSGGRAAATRSAGVAEARLRQLRRAGFRGLEELGGASGAWAVRLGGAGRKMASLGVALAETGHRQLGHLRDQALRTSTTTALSGFATGLALVLVAIGLVGRPSAPPDRPLPVGRVSGQPQIAPSRAASPHRGPSTAPVAEARRPFVEPSTGPLEVVAIRFGVVDRRRPDWTWSWRVTVHKPNDAARVNARIEYLEFQGSARRLVGYEELCGVRLASGPLESIEGTRSISAADSRRISAMTATVSAATDGAEATACRPSQSTGGSQLRA